MQWPVWNASSRWSEMARQHLSLRLCGVNGRKKNYTLRREKERERQNHNVTASCLPVVCFGDWTCRPVSSYFFFLICIRRLALYPNRFSAASDKLHRRSFSLASFCCCLNGRLQKNATLSSSIDEIDQSPYCAYSTRLVEGKSAASGFPRNRCDGCR